MANSGWVLRDPAAGDFGDVAVLDCDEGVERAEACAAVFEILQIEFLVGADGVAWVFWVFSAVDDFEIACQSHLGGA